MKNLIKTTCLAALVFAACQKTELPETIQDDPVFSVNFDLAGGSQNLTAGKDSIYLFTGSRFDATTDLRTFVANFSNQKCASTDCPGSLSFELRSNHTGNQFIQNESLTSGAKKIFDSFSKSDTTYFLNFTATGGGDQAQFSWEVDGVNLGSGATAKYEFDYIALKTLNLASTDADGFRASIKTPMPTDGAPACPVPVLTAEMQKSSVILKTGVPAGDAEIKWDDNSLGTFEQPIVSPDQTFGVLVHYTKIENCAVRLAIDKLPNDALASASTPQPSFTISTEITPGDQLQLGSSGLVFREKNGTTWRTDAAKPADDDFFEILEIENYQPNELGQPTLKMKIRFACTMKNGLGESKKMSGEGVIAVAK